MTQPIIIFATPSLNHAVSLDYLKSWTNTVWLLKDADIAHGRVDRGGDCFVAKVRNKLVSEFLDGPGTDLFFLDDDLGWPAQKVIDFISRPEPIIAGVYPKKSDAMDWPVGLRADGDTGGLIKRDGLYLASFTGTGFMRIKREVLERLAAVVPTFKDIEIAGVAKEFPLIFNAGLDADGWFCGEDVAFCRLANAHGFDIWVDPDIDFKHRGGKAWAGNLSRHLDTFQEKATLAVRQSKESP